MQVEKNIDETISVTATVYLYQHCACKRSLRTGTKLLFCAFRAESGERANLPGIRLLLPSASKIPAKLFPRHIVSSENNRQYFLGLGK